MGVFDCLIWLRKICIFTRSHVPPSLRLFGVRILYMTHHDLFQLYKSALTFLEGDQGLSRRL